MTAAELDRILGKLIVATVDADRAVTELERTDPSYGEAALFPAAHRHLEIVADRLGDLIYRKCERLDQRDHQAVIV